MKRLFAAVCIASLLLLVSGCSTVRKYTTPDDENLLSGAGSLMKGTVPGESSISTQGFEEIDLDKLLEKYGLDNPPTVAAQHAANAQDYQYRRNDLQERLIAASNQRCGAYIRTIISSKSQTQTVWTSMATLLSGAAAVVPHVQTAKALAAGSTVSTGLMSTYNEAYFNNLAITVVTAGISKQRESILESISGFKSRPLTTYSVNAAISDALAYHAACNIVSGMETAATATKDASNAKFSPLAR